MVLVGVLVLVGGAGWLKVYLQGESAGRSAAVAESDTGVIGIASTSAAAETDIAEPAQKSRSIDQIVQLAGVFEQRAALYRLAAGSNTRALKSLIAQSLKIQDIRTRREFLHVLYGRFSEIDPVQSLDHLRRTELGLHRYEIVREIFSNWARHDTDAAIAAIKDLKEAKLIQAAGDGILLAHQHPGQLISNEILMRLPIDYYPGPVIALAIGALAAEDPESATAQALALHDAPLRRGALHAIGEAWGDSDPAAALNYAVGIANRNSRWHLEHTILERWAGTDPNALLAVIADMPINSHRDYLMRSAITSVAERDPLKAIGLIFSGELNLKQAAVGELLSAAYSEWAKTDFHSALLHAQDTLPRARRRDVLSWIASTHARNAPLEALDWMLAYTGNGKRELVRSVVAAAARTDVNAVVSFISALDNPKSHGIDTASLIYQIASEDPQAAMGLLDVLSGQERMTAARAIAGSMARADPQTAIEWATQQDSESRFQAMQAVLQSWAHADPTAAAEFIAANRDYRNNVGAVVGSYAQQHPAAALDWLIGLGDEELTARHVSQVFMGWAQEDPTGAALKISEYSNSAWSEAGMSTVVSAWADESPREAAAWLASVPERLTPNVVTSLGRQWARSDPDSAMRWAQNLASPLRDNALSTIISQMPPSPANLEMIGTISSEDLRFTATFGFAHRYMQEGRDIEELLRAAKLSPDYEAKIRERLSHFGGR